MKPPPPWGEGFLSVGAQAGLALVLARDDVLDVHRAGRGRRAFDSFCRRVRAPGRRRRGWLLRDDLELADDDAHRNLVVVMVAEADTPGTPGARIPAEKPAAPAAALTLARLDAPKP